MKKILVTGGAGFIGSHVADALLVQGHDVHVVDDLSAGRIENVNPGVGFHRLDIRSEAIKELFQAERFEVLVHHAAQMDVRKSVADPSFDADVNIRGMLNLMEAGRSCGLEKVVFASTGGAIYGDPEYVPQDESHPLRPQSPYGITKLCTEKYLDYYRATYGISYVALRYGNVYGPRQNPHGEAGVIAIFSRHMLRGDHVIINGDGKQTRDYVFVGDVVRANVRAVSIEESAIINIGTGIETSVNDLFLEIRNRIDPSIPERHGPGMPGEQMRSVLSNKRAKKILDWQPRTAFKDGIAKTVRWFQTHVTEDQPDRTGR